MNRKDVGESKFNLVKVSRNADKTNKYSDRISKRKLDFVCFRDDLEIVDKIKSRVRI